MGAVVVREASEDREEREAKEGGRPSLVSSRRHAREEGFRPSQFERVESEPTAQNVRPGNTYLCVRDRRFLRSLGAFLVASNSSSEAETGC